MTTAIVVATTGAGCRMTGVFECTTNEQCRRGTEIGSCEPNGYCAFADPSCPSLKRYDATAGDELANVCVDVIVEVNECPNALGDEDGDDLGDPCDPCPPFAEKLAGAGDSDGDGVGNLCDPNPQTPGDRIALFEGFHAGVPASWTVAGTWTQTGDVHGTANSMLMPAHEATPDETITTRIAATAALQGQQMLIVGDPLDASPSGIFCGITGGGMLQLGAGEAYKTETYPAAPGPHVIALTRSGPAYACSATNELTSTSSTATLAFVGVPAGRQAAVLGYLMSSKVSWVMVVTSPPKPAL